MSNEGKSGKQVSLEIQIMNLNQKIRTHEDTIRALQEELRAAREHAIHDHLTGLKTREAFEDATTHELEKLVRGERHAQESGTTTSDEQHFSLLYLDLKEFKSVNDTYGHEAGDTVLKYFSTFLKQYFNRGSDIVARLGGDEFVILLSGVTPKAKAEHIKQKFLSALEGFEVPVTNNNGQEHIIPVHCSVGVSSTSDGHRTAKDLKMSADQDMYAHKETQRAAR